MAARVKMSGLKSIAKKTAKRPPQVGPSSHLSPEYLRLILVWHACGYATRHIVKLMGDADWMIQFDLPSRHVDKTSIQNRISQFTPKEISTARAAYYSTFDDVPLAHKKNRILMLQKIAFRRSTDDETRIQVLKAIRDEIGEDTDKIADALRGAGPRVDAGAPPVESNVDSKPNIRESLRTTFGPW